MRALGSRQSSVLKVLIWHKGWQEKSCWMYDTKSGTKSTLDSLVKRGFVRCEDGFYTPIKDELENQILTTVTEE